MRNSCLKASFFPDESRRVAYVKPDHIEERFQLAQSQFLPTPVCSRRERTKPSGRNFACFLVGGLGRTAIRCLSEREFGISLRSRGKGLGPRRLDQASLLLQSLPPERHPFRLLFHNRPIPTRQERARTYSKNAFHSPPPLQLEPVPKTTHSTEPYRYYFLLRYRFYC
jgi:hypothetical protein